MQVTFWGVRGSIPGCNPNQQNIGGHTSCVSLKFDEHLVVFDAGTGLINLGKWILETSYREIHLFISHAHFDHILGLPFFKPFWHRDFKIHIYAGLLEGAGTFRDFLENTLFHHPLFPVPFKDLQASIIFHNLEADKENIIQDLPIKLQTFSMNHPGTALGYRLTYNNKSVCYLSDMEHKKPSPDPSLVTFSQEASLLIYDATYTDEEYVSHIGWGHSTWQEGIKLAQQAKAKHLAFFHHAAEHTDEQMNYIEKKAQKTFPHAFVARQGFQLDL